MKKKIILVVLIFLYNINNVLGQSEKIQFIFGNFYVPQVEMKILKSPLIRQFGFSYTHELSPIFSVRASYIIWYDWYNFGMIKPYPGKGGYYTSEFFNTNVGHIDKYFDYQFLEVSGVYRNLIAKKHEIYGAIGFSYAWGKYSELVAAYRQPGYEDWLLSYETKKGKHFGILCEVGYNYFIAKKINIGFSEAIRIYNNLPIQLYTNINIGYNFNLVSPKKK